MSWLIGHLVGDYLLQNDWQAQGKKKAHLPCLVHVSLYTLAVMLFTQWPLWAIPVIFIPHYLIDRWSFVPWYMRLIGQGDFMKASHLQTEQYGSTWHVPWQTITDVKLHIGLGPWSIIVVDNVMHLVCLYFTDLLVKAYG
jgi:hypothetical protein